VSIEARRLRSGRTIYDVRLRAPDGRQYKKTLRTRKEAEAYIVKERAALLQGTWVDPKAGKVRLDAYAAQWLLQRTALRPRTVELYEYLLRLHVLPGLGSSPLEKITPMQIRAWHARLSTEHHVSATTAAKAYRLLRSILSTAVDDELLSRNPCVLRGAGVERSVERPTISINDVSAIADAVDPRYRAMVQLATWAGLRFGEVGGLKRLDVDLKAGTVRIERQLLELKSGKHVEGPPKSAAGHRLIALPPHVVPEIALHLASFVGSEPTSHVFTSPDGNPLRRSNFNRRVWQPACAAVGIQGFRFHDLRHTGNTFAASTGASTKELMARMGHASPRAALIYQHASPERDRVLADALSRLVGTSQARPTLRLVESVEGVAESDEEQWSIFGTSPEVETPPVHPIPDISPDQRGGDDGTRTHDPLLANLTAAYLGEQHGAYGLMSGAPGAA
jgi:integrase